MANTYFVLERDPDPNYTDDDFKKECRNYGAAENLEFVTNGQNHAVELNDVQPFMHVVSRSDRPVDP